MCVCVCVAGGGGGGGWGGVRMYEACPNLYFNSFVLGLSAAGKDGFRNAHTRFGMVKFILLNSVFGQTGLRKQCSP